MTDDNPSLEQQLAARPPKNSFTNVWPLIQDEVALGMCLGFAVAIIVLGLGEVGAGIAGAATTNYFKNKTGNGGTGK